MYFCFSSPLLTPLPASECDILATPANETTFPSFQIFPSAWLALTIWVSSYAFPLKYEALESPKLLLKAATGANWPGCTTSNVKSPRTAALKASNPVPVLFVIECETGPLELNDQLGIVNEDALVPIWYPAAVNELAGSSSKLSFPASSGADPISNIDFSATNTIGFP